MSWSTSIPLLSMIRSRHPRMLYLRPLSNMVAKELLRLRSASKSHLHRCPWTIHAQWHVCHRLVWDQFRLAGFGTRTWLMQVCTFP